MKKYVILIILFLAACTGGEEAVVETTAPAAEATAVPPPTVPKPTATALSLPELTPFTSEAANFTALMPTGTTEKTEPVLTDFSEAIITEGLQMLIDEQGKRHTLAYAIWNLELPGVLFITDEKYIDVYFNNRRDDFVAGLDGDWENQDNITLAGFPGREITFHYPNETGTADSPGVLRLYLIGEQLYALSIRSETNTLPRQLAEQFMNSFELIHIPSLDEYEWQTYTPESGGFSALFPHEPLETTQGNAQTVALRTQNMTYEISYIDSEWSKTPQNSVEIEQYLDSKRDSFADKGTLVEETAISMDGFPGRQLLLHIENPVYPDKAWHLIRFYLVGNRLYILLVDSTEMLSTSSESRFFDSFEVLQVADQPETEWPAFTSDEGNFHVLFPQIPTEQPQLMPTQFGPLEALMYMSGSDIGTAYAVAYVDYPNITEETFDIEAGLDGSRDGILGNLNATLVSESDISLDGNPGRHITFEIPADSLIGMEAVGIARLYFVDNRLYQLLILGREADVTEADITRFLDSFELIRP